MNAKELVILLAVGTVAGVLAQAILGRARGGLPVAVGAGVLGAYLGRWAQTEFGLPMLIAIPVPFGLEYVDVLWTVVGAIVLVALWAGIEEVRR